jgi:hypothetical protein
MRYARILSIGLVATGAFAWSAAAVEDAHELALGLDVPDKLLALADEVIE